MLQIDQKEIQVYSCSFRINIHKITIPLKVQGKYYIQWKLKTVRHGTETPLISSQTSNNNQIIVDESLKIHAEMFLLLKTNKYYKRFTQITVYVVSSRDPTRPKIVGSMMVGLHQVMNNNRYSSSQKHLLKYSSFQAYIEFYCQNIQCKQSSILKSNLDSALFAEQNFVTNLSSTFYKLGKEQSKDSKFEEQHKNQKKYLQDEETFSHGEYSFLQPQYGQQTEDKYQSENNSQSKNNRPCLISNSHVDKITKFYQQQSESRAKTSLQQSRYSLLRQNKNLKRLLTITNNQKNVQVERLEEEIKELIRQLSIKDAQILKLNEQHQSGSYKVGELLDQQKRLNQKLESCTRNCELLTQKLNLQKVLSKQLDQNYKRLESRLELVKQWQVQKAQLLQQIKNLKEQNNFLKLKNSELQLKLQQTQSTHLKSTAIFKSQIQTLQSQIATNTSILQLYEQKFNRFEQEISYLQQQEITHRSAYSSGLTQTKQDSPIVIKSNQEKPKKNMSPINIEQEQHALQSINQEDLEQSLISAKAEKQIVTSADLPPQQNFQTHFYRKMARDVQQELNILRVLYQQKDSVIKKERKINNDLYEELQRLRFQFVYELSKVTALLNQKIFEIRELKDENIVLKSQKSVLLQQKIISLTQQINILNEQKLEYFDRCYRLEEENINLINLAREKQTVMQSLLQPHQKEQQQVQSIVQQFQNLLCMLMNNQQKYSIVLRKYNLLQQSNLMLESNCQMQISSQKQKPQVELSDLIYNFNKYPCNLIQQLDCSEHSAKNSELLLQSQQRFFKPENLYDSRQQLTRLLEELIRLNEQRMRENYNFKKKNSLQQDNQRVSTRMKVGVQSLKKAIIRVQNKQLRQQLLRLAKQLENDYNIATQ